MHNMLECFNIVSCMSDSLSFLLGIHQEKAGPVPVVAACTSENVSTHSSYKVLLLILTLLLYVTIPLYHSLH